MMGQDEFEALMAELEELERQIDRAMWQCRTQGFVVGLVVVALVRMASMW